MLVNVWRHNHHGEDEEGGASAAPMRAEEVEKTAGLGDAQGPDNESRDIAEAALFWPDEVEVHLRAQPRRRRRCHHVEERHRAVTDDEVKPIEMRLGREGSTSSIECHHQVQL
ncbi:hypothetical protein ZWY2020_010254 [Hordeum vulgare]|nr:hypothetical protein ZWY2020_010254 [Hordeum vulgare]